MKKNITPTQKYKNLKSQITWLTIGKYVSIAAPFVIIAGVNYESYFKQASGVSVGIGFVLCAVILGISWIKELKKDTNKKYSNLMTWAIVFGLTLLFQSILTDLTLIIGCGLGGQVVGTAFNTIATNKNKIAEIYKESLIKKEVEQVKEV